RPHYGTSRSPTFFLIHTATSHTYTLSLHDALPIFGNLLAAKYTRTEADLFLGVCIRGGHGAEHLLEPVHRGLTRSAARFSASAADRKSTRLNSSHLVISYAVFCLKKK